MSDRSFDRLTRSLATRFNRRQALAAGVAVSATAGVARTMAQEPPAETPPAATPPAAGTGPGERTFFLFVQTFSAGTMGPHPTDPNLYTLTLSGHAAETVYFSDRPERIVGSVPTTHFLDTLGFSPDNPPNAALVAGEQVVVLELFNPVYRETFGDEGTVTLTYDVAILDDYAEAGLAHLARQADGTLPERFASASLFIDDCPVVPIGCYAPGLGHVHNFVASQCFDQYTGCIPCDQGWGAGWDALSLQCDAMYPEECQGRCQYVDES